MTIEQKYQIDFLLKTDTKGIFFNPHLPKGLEFIPRAESGLRFVLRPSNPEEDACGIRMGLECKLFSSISVTKEQFGFVDSYINRKVMIRVADNISLPHKREEEILIDEEGHYKDGFHPRRYLCPNDIKQIIEDHESKLSSHTSQFLRLLRWRQGIDGPSEIIESTWLYWKVGIGDYELVPVEGGPHWSYQVPGINGLHWNGTDSQDLQELWKQDDIEEPLGHALLREAIAIASESPRSSILILHTALETAVKMHISRIAPDTGWLMKNIPSPPIYKMFKAYFPEIHRRRGNDSINWENLRPFFNKVQKFSEIRNEVAHTGKIPKNAPPIRDNIVLVSDLLCLLDVLDGHKWAMSLASKEFRKALDWTGPTHGMRNISVKITQVF